MAQILKGAPVARTLTAELITRAAALTDRGVKPALAIVRVGERSDDLSYERGALKRAGRVGIAVRQFVLPETCTQKELMGVIGQINDDPAIHGCLVFRPVPKSLDEAALCAALDPDKDVDCLTMGSLAGVFTNRPQGFPPCTAEAVVLLLKHYDVRLTGADITVIGRSLVIGKPVSMMLQAENATVTMCHTRTRDLPAHCRRADILVVAAGHPATVGRDAVREGQTIVDVGINWDEEAGALTGDVAFGEVEPIVAAITPVPGGVGAVTTAVLAKHVIEAAERACA